MSQGYHCPDSKVGEGSDAIVNVTFDDPYAALPLLPVNTIHNTLGEGCTPFTSLKHLGAVHGFDSLHVKNESINPTGSFKDRETAIAINKAVELSKKDIHVVSSGNGGLSAAAYANTADMNCTVYFSKGTSEGKRELLRLFGANIEERDQEYEDIYRGLVDSLVENNTVWNITSGKNIFREEGNKIISYEIYQQHGVPSRVVLPIGNGSLFLVYTKGFGN